MNWDDIRIFLCIARRKKLSAAAAELKMDETTVSRRLKRLEASLGQTLFERLRTGHILTVHGDTLLITAEEIERNAQTVLISDSRDAQKPSGTLRISVSEGFGADILSPVLHEFSSNFPDIEIDLVSGSGFLSLSKREADVSIGLARQKLKQISSEFLGAYDLHLYASADYLRRHPPIKSQADLTGHTLIDYVDDLLYSEELRYFYEGLPNLKPTIRSTSIVAQRQLIANGTGLGILPDFMAAGLLEKVLPQSVKITRGFWFSAHQSVAVLAKVKVFRDFALKRLSEELTRKY